MQRTSLVRTWYLAVGIGSVVITIMVSGVTAALFHTLGYWAYPVSFAMYIGSFAIVFVFLIPSGKTAAPRTFSRFFRMEDARFERGIWPWVRRRGVPFFVGVATLLLGPIVAAVLIRFLGIPERKAWRYALVSTSVSVAFWVSLYLGLMDRIMAFFGK